MQRWTIDVSGELLVWVKEELSSLTEGNPLIPILVKESEKDGVRFLVFDKNEEEELKKSGMLVYPEDGHVPMHVLDSVMLFLHHKVSRQNCFVNFVNENDPTNWGSPSYIAIEFRD